MRRSCHPAVSIAAILVMVICLVLPDTGAAADVRPSWNPQIANIGTTNLAPNSSFEAGASGWSSIGQLTAWGGELTGLTGEIDNEQAYDGAASLRIEMGPGKTPVTHFDGWPAQEVVQTAPLAGHVGWIKAEEGEPYTFSVYMKADRAAVPAQLAFYFSPDPRISTYNLTKRSTNVSLTTAWAQYTFTLPAESPEFFVAVGPDLSATPDAAATVWIDAIQVERGTTVTDYAPRQAVEVGLSSPHFSHVFPAGESPRVIVTASNRSSSERTVEVSVSLEDYFSNPLPPQKLRLDIGAGESVSAPMELGIDAPGFYRATFTWAVDEKPHKQLLRVVSLPPFALDDSILGVNHAPPNDNLCRMLAKAGILWVRDCSFDWDRIEPTEGAIDFSSSDAQVNRVLKNGLKVMALLPSFSSAGWASEAPENLEELIPNPPPYPPQWPKLGYAPRDPETLYRFIRAAVSHFKDRVHVWEFMNEPFTVTALVDTKALKLPGPRYTTQDYVDLLAGAEKAMREADPNCVVLGGMQGPPMEHSAEFIENGGLAHVDVYTIHPYGLRQVPEWFIEPMRNLQEAMQAADAGARPIWLTESGYYGEDDLPWTPYHAPAGHFSASWLQRDEREAADYTIRHGLIMLAHGAEKIFIHQPIEGELNNGNNFIESPLWTQGGAPEKLYAACAAFAGILGPSSTYAGPLKKPEHVDGKATDAVHGYAFQRGKDAVLAVWAVPEEGETETMWTLHAPDSAVVYNIVGATVDGTSLPLGASAVYVVGEGVDASTLRGDVTLRYGK